MVLRPEAKISGNSNLLNEERLGGDLLQKAG